MIKFLKSKTIGMNTVFLWQIDENKYEVEILNEVCDQSIIRVSTLVSAEKIFDDINQPVSEEQCF